MQVRKGEAEKEILEVCLKLKMEGQPITSENVSKIIARSRDWSHELLSRMVKKGVLIHIRKLPTGYVYEWRENNSSPSSL